MCLVWVGLVTAHAHAACKRPKDFSVREDAQAYDGCVKKNGYAKPPLDPRRLDKTSCLHDVSDIIGCRKKELRGESIKTVETTVYGASPTPGPKIKPVSGDVPLDESATDAKPKEGSPKKPGGGIGSGNEPAVPVNPAPPAPPAQ